MNEATARKIIDTTVDLAGTKFDGVEVSLHGSDVATSRFANCQMTQNQAPSMDKLSIRVLKDGRQIRMETCDTSLEGIKNIIEDASQAVKYSEPDKDLEEILDPASLLDFKQADLKEQSRIDSMAKKMTAGQRAAHVSNIISVAKNHDLSCAGVVATGTKFESVGNSKGLFRFHEESHVECSVTMVGSDSTGWAKSQSPRAVDVNPSGLGLIAAKKAISASKPRDIVPGRYTAILEASAVLDLLGFLLWDFAATSHRDRQSCLMDKLEEQVFGQNINIVDDVYDEKQAGSFFDAEGLQRKRINLVENGRLVNLVYGRRSARLSNKSATGHGLPEPSMMGEYPMNPIMLGGSHSLEDMVNSTSEGILLSRVWYVRTVDPARKILTGMTRDGTYKIENGAIAHGVKNLRFNISLIELLNKVEMLGEPVRAAGEESFPAVVPPIKVADFNFTEVTRF